MMSAVPRKVCAVEAALDAIGGKWKGLILYHLMRDGVLRFNELRRLLHGVTQRVLTKQLRELEQQGVIERKIFAEVPPRVEYQLTESGKALRPVIEGLRTWGLRFEEEAGVSHECSIIAVPQIQK